MPNKKISEFNENLTPNGANILPIVSSGDTEYITLSGLTIFILSGISTGSTISQPLIYKALISQLAAAVVPATDNGSIIVGQKYTITNYQIGDDFTNVGAASNSEGVVFVAIGTTAAVWNVTGGFNETTLVSDETIFITSKDVDGNFNPFVNTLGGSVTFSYIDTGAFTIDSAALFPLNKTTITFGNPNVNGLIFTDTTMSDSSINLYTQSDFTTASDNVLRETSITIEVYQ